MELAVKPTTWEGDEEILNNPDRLRQYLDDLTKLVEAPGKKYLDRLLRLRYDGIMAGLAGSPLQTLDGALAQEYYKGQAFECLNQQQMCENLIALFKERIHELTFEEDEDGE